MKNTIELFAVSIASFPMEQVEELLKCVSEEKRNRLLRFRFQEDLQQSLTGELLIRKMVSEKLNVNPKTIILTNNSNGKPFLSNRELEFNLSHSGEWVVCVLAPWKVGIDIEKKKQFDLEVAQHYFTVREQAYLACDAEDKLDRFYRLWTAKESYIKAVGIGLSMPLNRFSTTTGEGPPKRMTNGGDIWYFRSYPFDPQYCLSMCSSVDAFPEDITKVDIHDLVDFFKQ